MYKTEAANVVSLGSYWKGISFPQVAHSLGLLSCQKFHLWYFTSIHNKDIFPDTVCKLKKKIMVPTSWGKKSKFPFDNLNTREKVSNTYLQEKWVEVEHGDILS